MKTSGIRTCLSCRSRKPKRELWRFTVDIQGRLVCDERMCLDGRGAYCCCNEQCLHGMLRNRRGLANTLRYKELRWDEALMKISGWEKRTHTLPEGHNEAGVRNGKN